MSSSESKSTESKKKYALVLFDNGDISVVPSNWLDRGGKCKWPKHSLNKRTLIMKRVIPKDDWQDCKFNLIESYDEYEEALKAEKEYAKTTTEEEDLLQRDKGKRKIKIKKNEDFAIPNFKNYHITESIREDSLLSEAESNTGSTSSISIEDIPVIIVSENEEITQQKVDEEITLQLKDVDLDETVIVENQQQQIQLLLDIALENKAMLKILTKQQDENKRKDFVENQLFKEISSMLPLKSITKLLEFEERLKEDERFSLAVLQKFSSIGGSEFKNNVRRIMTSLLTNDVGMLVSWTGQKNNLKIGDFTTMDIVRSAVKNCFPLITDREYELAVSEWLRYSKQRKNREKDN